MEPRGRFSFRVMICAASLILPSFELRAQGLAGAVTGVATDPTQAVLVGAEVTLANVETGISTRTVTNGAGVYNIPSVPIGTYNVRVQASGFKSFTKTGVIVTTAQVVRVDAELSIGQASESVTVTAEAPLLQQETSSVGTQVTQMMLNGLPFALSGRLRDPIGFITLTPGATGGSSSSGGMRIAGSRAYANEIFLDGLPLTYNASQNVPDITRPAYDTIAEFKVESVIPPAEYGRTSGGVVMIASRSGTNELHGNLVGLLRNNVFDSRRFNARIADINRQTEFAGSVGGPVYLPKLYDGRNKTFFFFNYTGFRYAAEAQGANATVPTEKMRAGDFSENAERIFDPQTADAAGQRQQFPNNVIPASRISPIALKLNEVAVPIPNVAGFNANYLTSTSSTTDTNEYYGKIDQQINDSHRLSGSVRAHENARTRSEGPMPKISDLTHDAPATRSYILSYDYIVRPNLVNRIQTGAVRAVVPTSNSTNIGMQVPGAFDAWFPAIRYSGQGLTGFGYTRNDLLANTNYYLQQALSWTKGTHNFKFGARLDAYQNNNRARNNTAGTYTFSQFGASQPNVTRTGHSYASYLLGLVNNASMSESASYGYRSKYLGLYAQDDWKISRRLTMNYGVRWEMQMPWSEVAGRVSMMDQTLANPGAGGIPGALIFGGDGQGRTGKSRFMQTYLAAGGPRLGLVYQLTPRTVIRTGYGMYYSPLVGYDLNRQGFDSNVGLNSQDGGLTPVFLIDRGWPAGTVKQSPFIDPTVVNGGTTATTDVRRGQAGRLPRTSQWQFGLQHTVKEILFEASYVGTVGHGITNNQLERINQVDPQYLSLGALLTRNINDPAVVAAGYRRPYPTFNGTLAQSLRRFPQYSDIGVQDSPTGNTTYHALLFRSQKRFSNGLQFLLSYALSKSIADVAFNSTELSGPQDQYNRRAEKSLGDLDIPQRLVLSYSYELPFGQGKRFALRGVANQVFGGWQVAGVHIYQSGGVLRITTPNGLPIFNGHLRPNRAGDVPIRIGPGRGDFHPFNGLSGETGDLFLDRNAFSVPQAYTFGNLGVFLPDVRGFGSRNEDISMFKKFRLRERKSLELRADLFNAINRRNLNSPSTDLSSANFGRITGQGAARIIQFGLRVDF